MENKDYEIEIINKCNSLTKVEILPTSYGYQEVHKVDGKKVTLSFNQYNNFEDGDYYDELVDVKIE